MTTKLAVFYGFSSEVSDQFTASFKKSGVDCLCFCANNCDYAKPTTDLKKGVDVLNAEAKSIIDALGGREIDFLVVSTSTNQGAASLIGADYAVWRDGLFECLEKPLFLASILLKYLSVDARLLFLLNHAAFVPIIGKGTYSVSQYGLRMAINILSMERPETIISSALIDDDLFVSNVGTDGMRTEATHTEAIEQFDSSTMARFLKWLLFKTDGETFSERQWDSRDKDLQKVWLENQLHH